MRAEDRQRHRHHDDQRVAEAFELRRQHQIDDDDGGPEGDQDRVALFLLLPRLAGIVDEEGVGQALLGDVFQALSAVAGGHAGQRQRRKSSPSSAG